MRTLSLGVLIVCGGTLAALPFRRYQTIPDASAEPTQVTGPTQSALHTGPPNTPGAAAQQLPSLADANRLDVLGGYSDSLSIAANQLPAQRRHVDIPLTYEDLAVPIDQPKPVMDRFSATTAVRQEQQEADRLAGLVMPALETLPVDQQQELFRVADTVASPAESTRAKAGGRLASTANHSSTANPSSTANSSARTDPGANSQSLSQLQPLPTSQQADRERFWIRQPD